MNGLLHLELWRIIGQGNDEIGGGYSGGGKGWFHNHIVQQRSYHGSRAGHGSTTVGEHGRVNLAGLPTAMSHDHGNLSNPVLEKRFCSIFTRPYHTAVLPPVV
ncbi:hypothetical protein GOBAR_AA14990 [Gossypium barbadense]|uniref:Uncharacterized protein n=1 Tax=Gossypium barbadense TaxID=3634 RepID=A0A2P5XQN9_GOSBA|nr:hypothetical protein GOBAR_AA14990 [Gossypium barbadense]